MSSGRQTQPPAAAATAAGPKPATPTFGSGEWAIGHSIQITTVTGQVQSGVLLIHDPISQTIVLSSSSRSVNGIDTPPSSSLVDLQIIKISSIREIRAVAPRSESFKPYEAKLITLQDFKAREELAQKRALEEEKRLGVGVTVEGQKIYDAFAKTLPLKWVDKSILVADQALINPPYTIESVVSVSAALNGNSEESGRSALLDRVKHVLQQERTRLGLTSAVKAPAEGIRKGG